MTKTVTLAKHAGFCYGVKRAVETTKKIKAENKDTNVCVLGELIHNSHVIKELERQGIITIDDLSEVDGGICIVRSHGASPEVFDNIIEKGFELVDLTCPDVKKVQKKAIELVQNGCQLIIVGKSEHPEVIAIKANAEKYGKNIFVLSSLSEAEKISDVISAADKIGIVVQTTQRVEIFDEICAYISSINDNVQIHNTICASTSLRQNDAKNLAKTSDLVVVVGSKNSANTTHLAEILSDITTTIHIEDEQELIKYENLIKNASNIGVTAGASTPDEIIEKVMKKLNTY